MEDERFKHVITDPKFRRIPKGAQKVKIDKRFQSMFKDKKFKIKYTIDKRGRPVKHNSTDDLRRYYALSSEDESSDEESGSEKQQTVSNDSDSNNHSNEKIGEDSELIIENKQESDLGQIEEEPGKYIKQRKNMEDIKSKLVLQSGEAKNVSEEARNKLKNLSIDYARGEASLFSESSSDDEESEDELSESDQIEHKWGELDADADKTDEVTYRLAGCNMDWDRIRAVDLMVLLNSFLPPGGTIKSVAIYPSEFGKHRIQEEELKGPIELVDAKPTEDKDETEDEEGSQYHMEKLRQYQLNRLKYFYSVIVFDNPQSANKVYTECDGMEYESSAVKLDLRFIPDDMTFDDQPKDFCDKLPEVNKYQPRFFTTTALQQVKVNLTWDETNPERTELTQKLSSGKIDDISEADLQNYLASSSGGEDQQSDDDDVDDKSDSDTESKADVIDKYKALLQDIEDKENSKNEKDVELEISWGIDLKEKTDKLAKEKQSSAKDMTPFQKYIEKRKEKRKERKQQKKKLNEDDNQDEDSDFPSDIDKNDPYFAEEFSKNEFKKPKTKKISQEISENGNEEKQAELELLLMNEDDNRKHFSLTKIQKNEANSKKKKTAEKYEDNFEINVKDERFTALFSSHHYNIDPTDPHYKKTKGMEALISEKLKRRIEDTAESENDISAKLMKNEESVKNNSKKIEINMLVKSVKRKTKEFKNKG